MENGPNQETTSSQTMSEVLGTADIVLVDTKVFVAVGCPDRDQIWHFSRSDSERGSC
jgi:hypothetical protein